MQSRPHSTAAVLGHNNIHACTLPYCTQSTISTQSTTLPQYSLPQYSLSSTVHSAVYHTVAVTAKLGKSVSQNCKQTWLAARDYLPALASFLANNTGDLARKHINDPELQRFINIECYCWSAVLAALTPMMNIGMVFCDRHYWGINYPKGGVGKIAQALAGEYLAFMVCCTCAVCLIHLCHLDVYNALSLNRCLLKLQHCATGVKAQASSFSASYDCTTARLISARCAVLRQQQPL